jgi:hypothetical protein
MPIEDRNLAVGTRLVATYKKTTYHAQVVEGEAGKVLYKLEDGRTFKSPSAAGTAITNHACNGWMFWSVAQAAEEGVEAYPWADVSDDEPGEDAQEEQPAEAQQVEPSEEKLATFRRVPNQKGVSEGQVRLYCDACGKSFEAPADQPPDACPEGHRPDGSQVQQESQS